MKQELIKLEKQIQKFLDRIMNTDSDRLVGTYEDHLKKLESKKLKLAEKCDSNGESQAPFEEMFERAMTFLANPHNIWAKGTFEEKRTLLKLTFWDNLTYSRKTGYRTPKTP